MTTRYGEHARHGLHDLHGFVIEHADQMAIEIETRKTPGATHWTGHLEKNPKGSGIHPAEPTLRNTQKRRRKEVAKIRRNGENGETPGTPTKRATPRGVARFALWSCRELNPGPMTVPSVFYVRSPLALWRFFCPHLCRGRPMASIPAVKVPQSPRRSTTEASLLNDAQHPPEDGRE